MNVVVFFPGQFVYEKYKARPDIIFFDERGWLVYEDGYRTAIDDCSSLAKEPYQDLPAAKDTISKLRMFGPIWSRWISHGDQYELILRDVLLDIYRVYRSLLKFKINAVIFGTGVTHHIDTLIFEQACVIAGIKQIFLYSNNIMLGRLLPLLQHHGIDDRCALGAIISGEPASPYITRFLENKKLEIGPECGGVLPNRVRHGYFFSFFALLMFLLRRPLRKLYLYLRQAGQGTRSFTLKYEGLFGALDFSRQIRQQREACVYYRKSGLKSENFQRTEGSEVKLLIAAHYQPEASSFPEGWDLHNHIDIAIELRRLGYSGDIVYKEHLSTFYYTFPIIGFTRVGMYRSKRYYEELEQLGCRFLDSSFQLSLDPEKNNWYLPITITGSIAVERSLAGFHTIVTGHPWYKGIPGAIPLSSIESLAEIKPEWVQQDPELAKRASKFLDEMLSGKTITNVSGIGIGVPLTGEEPKLKFSKEFDALLMALRS
ncbi:MAG: hypothetical protein JW902_15620 [Syntrophaceae bacterium]|nr:hypothetical protein [Syntrophaceae bacterium]